MPLPSIILANAQSLRNKLDVLQANVKLLTKYKNVCLVALTETWLKKQDGAFELETDDFGKRLRLDRHPQ